MNRPWIIWATSIVCMVIVLGAVGMVTHITLSLEEKTYVEDNKRQQVDKSIVAMEAYVDALFARENAREATEFLPVQSTVVKGGKSVEIENKINPLFNDIPDDVNFFWYNDANATGSSITTHSPQLPTWGELQNFSPSDEEKGKLESNFERNIQLNTMLCAPVHIASNGVVVEQLKQQEWGGSLEDNLRNVELVQQVSKVAYTATESLSYVQQKKEVQQKLKVKNIEVDSAWNSLKKESKQERTNRAALEKEDRFYTRAENALPRTKGNSVKDPNLSQKVAYTYALPEETLNTNVNPDSVVDNQYIGSFNNAEVSPFVALVLEEELVLVRYVKSDAGETTQGVWMNKQKIEEDLIDSVSSFLPNAKLEFVDKGLDLQTFSYGLKDAYGLSLLPYRIIPGDLPSNIGVITPMRFNLIVACTCILLAICAVLFMFRGVMKLSDRRASFVSSVSHELRTPLTTFKLYSEMLAEGMVKDENKKQEYLETLSKESDRLSHMVENVLSFSQLEHGKVKKELEEIKFGTLISQIDTGMQMRLNDEKIKYQSKLSEELMDVCVKVDATSVDQIITNLLDNAIKYGQPEEGEGLVSLEGELTPKHLKLIFSDNGSGVKDSATKRIFKAFHKSDVEAANSKPGVGLGLALSKKLAQSMGGELSLIESKGNAKGARFELKLQRV